MDRKAWARNVIDQGMDAAEDAEDPDAKDKIRQTVAFMLLDQGFTFWHAAWLIFLVWAARRWPRAAKGG